MKQTMDKQDDRLLREALGRRADKVPALSDDFEERVMARIKPLSGTSTRVEGQISRHRSWRVWAWVSSVAAVCIAIYIMIGGRFPTTIAPQGKDMPTSEPSLLAEDTKAHNAPKVPNAPNGSKVTKVLNDAKAPLHKPMPSTPSPRGGHGVGGASSSLSPRGGHEKGARAGSSPSAAIAPTLADLYAAIDRMTDEAIEEADRLMAEALVREYTDDEPS